VNRGTERRWQPVWMVGVWGLCAVVALLAWGCDRVKWAHVRVRNFSSEMLTDVRLVGVDPEVAFGYCSPDADKSTSLAEPITFTGEVAMEYRLNGELCRQPLNAIVDPVFWTTW